MKRILIPVKDTSENIDVIEEAVKIVDKFEGTITLLHVDNIHLILRELQYGNDVAKGPEIDENDRKELLKKVSDEYKKKNINVESKVLVGDPAEEIIKESESGDYDLIIMRTHGMSTTKRFMLGSVTDKVVHHVKKPIMVVR